MHTTRTPRILVTAATGKTGRRITQRLGAHGIAVRAGSRAAVPPFDWEHPSTWPAALDGATAAYIAYSPDLAMPGAVDTVDAFCRAATDAGVNKLVLLAGRGEPAARAAEDVVRRSGARWTIVRASFFAQNFSEDHLYEPIVAGELALPAGDVAEPFVDADDIADVVTAALLDERHDGQTYDVTGPRLMTFADAVAEISVAAAREVRYVAVTPAEYLADAVEHGVPMPLAEALTELFVEVLDGRNAHLGHGVRDALGRRPRDFRDYAVATAASGTWAPTDMAAPR